MGVFDMFEKLINEHGSAAILREHLALLKAEQAALERKCINFESEAKALEAQVAELQFQLSGLQTKLDAMESGAHPDYCCDHCGSAQLRRTGNRRDPIFGDVGIKQALFTCAVCGKESAFTQAA